jgi:class 3 adenylate cyclase
MLFADVKGFSQLRDGQMPAFTTAVLGTLARVLDRYDSAIGHRNTWGDALYVVLDDACTAAACALDLQAAMASLDLAATGLPPSLALRLGAHVGPVLQLQDPVLRARVFCGSHVTRTARIEPVTPPGAVYITEHFAAALAVSGDAEFAYDYVGHMPMAKDYGRLRMHRLRRVTEVAEQASSAAS